MTFYEKVCLACKKADISVSSLLIKMNMSKANIRNWKNGVVPKIAVRTQIAKLTNTPITEFLTTEEKELAEQIRK